MNITTAIAGVLVQYIGTASGAHDMTPEQMKELARILDFFSAKSTTWDPRQGNPGKRYAVLPYGSINSMGLPNIGIDATIELINLLADDGRVIKASVAGSSLRENIRLMCALQRRSKAKLITVNTSCPNRRGKKIVAKNLPQLKRWLKRLSQLGDIPVGVKLPYYEELDIQKRVADTLVESGARYAEFINGILGLAIDIETEETLIHPNDGQGGVGGKYIQPFALRIVQNMYKFLQGSGVSLIGVGGIDCGDDAYAFLLAGADAVEVGTALEDNGPAYVLRIIEELQMILERKHTTIPEAKGRLKVRGL